MPLARDERDQWRAELVAGKPSELIIQTIQDYIALSKRDDWRSSRFVEILGEVAAVWLYEFEEI